MTTVSPVDPVAGRIARWVLSQPSGRVVAMSVVTMATVTAAAYVPFVWLLVTAFYDSRAGSAAAGAALVFNTAVTAVVLPRPNTELSQIRTWIDGDRSHPSAALRASFAYQRMVLRRAVQLLVVVYAFVMPPLVAWLADLTTVETVMYALLNLAGALTAPSLLSATSNLLMRPLRTDMAGAVGDEPVDASSGGTVASRLAWVGFSFATTVGVGCAALVSQFDTRAGRLGAGVLGTLGVALILGVTLWYPLALVPTVRPIRDLTATARRIGAGDYETPLEVTSDDDLGELVEAMNEMQSGLRQRERLRAAFGSYVDPSLAERLLEQGGDTFTGERVDVTVMFVDIRDFTPFAEANPAEATVARLNAVFEIVVRVVGARGGHVNKFLGDGAMAVFGAPHAIDDHADAAVAAATDIAAEVHRSLDGAVRIGIGINTGTVIAGTIGGAGKLEYTLIGDTVNVAARVEQLTKETGDTILLTQATVDALAARPPALASRGDHAVKGKSAPVAVHSLTAAPNATRS